MATPAQEDDRLREVAHAQSWLNDLIAQTEDGYESDDGKLGDGTGTYDDDTAHAESYMVGGGGPSGWLWFIVRTEDDTIDHAYMEYISATGSILVKVPIPAERALLDACRADAAERNRHG